MIIRDAVHGDIEFSEDEVSIMDTPEVQRLRGIKQLGASSFVYPSAVLVMVLFVIIGIC